MGRLKIFWLIFHLSVLVNAFTNEVEDEDVSIEDTSNSKSRFYDTEIDADADTLYKKKEEKPTISEDAIFLPHETYCQYFYAFDGKDSYLYRCASGYRFDSESLQCVKTKNANCGKRKKNPGSSEEKKISLTIKCTQWSGLSPHKHYCHLYYNCQYKKGTLYMCPPGKMFDTRTNLCLVQNRVKCDKRENPYINDDLEDVDKPDTESDVAYYCPQNAGTFPDQKYCNKFIRCWYGIGQTYVCPKGKLYDEDLRKCKNRNSVYCNKRIDPDAVEDEEEPVVVDENPQFFCFYYRGRYVHENCRYFYQCENFFGKLYACPQGKLFDVKSQSCKVASEVDCNDRDTDSGNQDDEFVCPVREGTFKDEENCGSYYKCKNGKAQRLHCPEGELFDTNWKSCNDENDVVCNDRLLPGDEEEEDRGNVIDENPKYNCEKPHGRFTHKEYCNWFYHCKDGKSSIRTCKKGRYYDSHRSRCYDEVDCGSRVPKDDYEVTTSKPREFVCPAKSGKFAHPRLCNAYYVCEKSKPKRHDCPKEKLFHDKWGSCVEESQVSCGHRVHPDVYEEDGESRIIDENPKYECKVAHGNFENDEYCDWFYSCRDKKSSLRECRKGKHYDSKSRRCQEEKSVSCGHRRRPEDRETSTTEKDITTREPEIRCREPHEKFPHYRDCSKFYECDKKYNYKEHKCPKKKLFDAKRKSCEDEDHVTCDGRIHPDIDEEDDKSRIIDENPKFECKVAHGNFENDEYCDWFYSCRDKKSSLRECRKGKHYDSKSRRCQEEKSVSCGRRKRPEDRETSTTEKAITTREPEFSCRESRGKFPHRRDCSKFYECDKKYNYKEHKCPKKKLFDAERKSCEDEDHVMCDSRIHPDMDPDEPEDVVVDNNPKYSCKNNYGRFTHNEFCHWYYNCHNKKSSVRECKRGKYYDSKRRKCYDSKDVDCDERKKPKDDDVKTTVEQRTTQGITDSTSELPATETRESSTKENDNSSPYISTVSTEVTTAATEITTAVTEITSTTTDVITTVTDVTTVATPSPTVEEDDNPDKIVDPNSNFTCDGDEGSFAHDSYCHYYYSCKNNKATLRECPEGKYFDIERASCEDWYLVSCGERLTPEEIGSTFDDFQSTPYIERISTTSRPETSTSKEPVTKPTFICPTSDGVFSHERNCGKYYECINNVVEEKMCPKGQLYNVDKRSCYEEQETNCGKRIHPNDDPDNKVVDPNPEFNCTDRHGCFTHERICKWYYYCHDKRPEVRECAGDKYFDSVRSKCLEWWMVFCGNRTTDDEMTSISTTVTSVSSTIAEGKSIGTTSNDKGTDSTNSSTEISNITTKSDKETDSTERNTKIPTDSGKRTKETDTTEGIFTGGSTYDRTTNTRVSDSSEYNGSTALKPRTTPESGNKTKNTDTTDSIVSTEYTDSRTDWTKVTSSDKETQSTGGRSKTTPETGNKTKTTTKSSFSTGSPDDRTGKTRVTDKGKVTTATIRTKSTPTPDTNTKSISTTESILSSRSTEDKKEKTKVTESEEETGSTSGRSRSTPKSDKITKSTGSTESTLRTGSTDDVKRSTRTTSNGKETRTTKEKNKSTTESGRTKRTTTTDKSLGTRSTKERTGTTAVTDNSKRTSVTTENTLGPSVTDISTETTRISGRDKTTKESGTSTKTTVTTESSYFTSSTDGKTGKTYTTDREGTVSTTGKNPVTPDSKRTKSTDTTQSDTNSSPDDKSGRTKSTKFSTKEVGSTTYRPSTTPESRKETTESTLNTGSSDDRTVVTGTKVTGTDRQTSSTKVRNKSTPEPGRKTKTLYTTESNFVTRSTDSITGRTGVTDRNKETGSTAERLRSTRDSESTTSLVTTEQPILDKCKEEDGDFHHPDECKKYFTCKDGEYSVNECGDGTLFDVQMRICYREDLVDCGNRSKPEVTTDDCDEWLRTSTTSPGGNTSPSTKGTTSPKDEGTGGTEATGETTNTREITENPGDKTSTSSDTGSEATKTDSTKSDETSSTESDKSTENNKLSTSSDTVSEYTKDDSTKFEKLISTEDDNSTHSSTVVTEIIEKERNVTDQTESTSNLVTDNSSDSTNSNFTTENDGFRTENTRSTITRDDEISTSQGTSETTGKNTDDYTSNGTTITTKTTDSPNTSEEPDNTSSTKDHTTSSSKPSSTKDSKETTKHFTTENYSSSSNTVTKEEPSPSITTDTGGNTELTKNPSESTTDKEMTKFTSSTGNDFSEKSTMEKRESTPNTSTDSENTGLTKDQTSPSGEETTKNTLTSGDESSDGNSITESTINPSTKPGKTDLTDGPSSPSDITSTTESKTEYTVVPSSSDISSTPNVTDSTQDITTNEDLNNTKTYTSPDGRNKTPTSEDKTESARTTESITDTSNTADISLQTRVITETEPEYQSTPTDDKTSDKSFTSSIDPRSTEFTSATNDISETTHKHTTMHPCLTHTHSTPTLPTSPPKIDCDENDIDCIQKKTGDINKWFTCPEKQGYFPHPYSKRLFIRCNNGKPRTKKCGKNLVFSVNYMRCVHED